MNWYKEVFDIMFSKLDESKANHCKVCDMKKKKTRSTSKKEKKSEEKEEDSEEKDD